MKNNIIKVNFKMESKWIDMLSYSIENGIRDDHKKWIELLTEGIEHKQIEFEDILANSKGTIFAIMKYRRLLTESRGQVITLNDLLDSQIKEEGHLIETLQELFLEKIELAQVEYFYKKASEKYDDMSEAFRVLYDRHIEDQGLRFMSIVLTI